MIKTTKITEETTDIGGGFEFRTELFSPQKRDQIAPINTMMLNQNWRIYQDGMIELADGNLIVTYYRRIDQ